MDPNRSKQTSEVQSLPISMADGSAVNLTLAENTGLLRPVSDLTLDQRRELADRSEFLLGSKELELWKELDEQPARNLPELRDFMAWRSPHIAYDGSESVSSES